MYNCAKTIIQAIDSVYAQTWTGDIEIIVVNDGSIDNSRAVVESYIEGNHRDNIVLLNQSNAGVSSARNEGMKRCIGDWICLLDADDVWLPNKLERQLQILEEHPEIDFLGTARNGELFGRVGIRVLETLNKISASELLFRFVFVTPTVIFRRSILSGIGYFDENQKYAEEGNYFIRIAHKYNSYLLNESLVITGGGKSHFGDSGLSSNLLGMEKGELKNIKLAYQMKIIKFEQYVFFVLYSILKYIRRVYIVKIRRRKRIFSFQ
jgi:glycosyltransferase involved in cell wall biosynthesis